ncbi:MAG TPA: YitT family protein [Candidatus Enterocloster faecavium]|uniref:YitT family protein n=1 Tax=Candidatus Enterocloster faecavium TaxID=2838560 RepID=A0A9D2L5Y2_9FIRM|nr:YitT family protein [Candidatus Enterocloster faecavium]
MREKTIWRSLAGRALMIVLGNLMYAMAVNLFIVPNDLITGGTTGLALFFNRTAGIPVSAFVWCFNVTMFLWGAWVLGKEFALSTAASTVIYPLMLSILEWTGVPGFVMEEKLVAVLYAGLLIGAGIGVVMRAGASTGGMDIPALIGKKKWNFNVSFVIYLFDCIILALQVAAADLYSILYGILLIMVYTLVLDKVLVMGTAKIQVKIVSREYEKINRLLGERIDCGTTLLHMESGYLHQEQEMVLAVISSRDLPKVNQLILDTDPEAFIVVSQINEVRGRGFTLNKVYRSHGAAGEKD